VHDAGAEIDQERLMRQMRLRMGLWMRWWMALGILAAVPTGTVAAAESAPTPPTASAVPALESVAIELHGTWNGQPFWARLLHSDPHFANHRVLQLLWTPPLPDQIDGVHLVDCPFVLLDDQARVVAWNGRDGISQVVPSGSDSYLVTREKSRATGADTQPVAATRTIGGGRGWDLHLAQLLLALAWKAGSSAQVKVIDLFGAHAAEGMSAAWRNQEAVIDHVPYHITADAQGHLLRLEGAQGSLCLDVAARVNEGPP
jgi:hypothetical protein